MKKDTDQKKGQKKERVLELAETNQTLHSSIREAKRLLKDWEATMTQAVIDLAEREQILLAEVLQLRQALASSRIRSPYR